MSNYDTYMEEGNGNPDGDSRSNKAKYAKKIATVTRAFKQRKDNEWDERWSKYIQIYSNKYPWDELSSYEDIVVPNMAFSTVNVIVPSIAVHAPKVSVNAKKQEHARGAEIAEAVVNHQWREFDVQDQIREAVKDFVILGHGWVKVTWDTKTEDRELSVDEWRMAVQQAVAEYQQMIQQSSLDESEFPSMDEVIENVPRVVEETVKDAPDVSRVSPFDMIVDPDALRIEDARWLAQRSFIPLETARTNEDWSPRVRRKLKPSVLSQVREDVDVDSDKDKNKDASFVVVYEYYDLLNGTVCVFAEGCDDFLSKPTKSPFPGVHPFVLLENYEVPERFYPIGDLEMIYSLQLELAVTRTQMMNDRKRGQRIAMYRSAAIGPEGVEALESGEDNVMLDVLEDRPFNDVFDVVSPVGLHPEWYNQSQMILDDINMVSGVSEYARGNMPDIKRTATEAGLIQDAANARSADKLFKVEQMMARVAERMIKLSQMFMDTEDVAKVVSEDQVVSWIPYDRAALQGDFSFEVEAGSSQPQNESFRRQTALQMMDVFGGLIGSGFLNDQKFLEHILRNGFGIKNADEMLGAGPMPPPPEAGGGPGGEMLPPGVDMGQQMM